MHSSEEKNEKKKPVEGKVIVFFSSDPHALVRLINATYARHEYLFNLIISQPCVRFVGSSLADGFHCCTGFRRTKQYLYELSDTGENSIINAIKAAAVQTIQKFVARPSSAAAAVQTELIRSSVRFKCN